MSEDMAPREGNLPHAAYRRFEGMREYEAIIDAQIPQTQRAIRIFDRALTREYNSRARHHAPPPCLRARPCTARARHEALRQFLLAGRGNRLTIVLHDASLLERECPRMIELVRQF